MKVRLETRWKLAISSVESQLLEHWNEDHVLLIVRKLSLMQWGINHTGSVSWQGQVGQQTRGIKTSGCKRSQIWQYIFVHYATLTATVDNSTTFLLKKDSNVITSKRYGTLLLTSQEASEIPASFSSDGTQLTWPWPCDLWRHTCCHTTQLGCFHRPAQDLGASWARSCTWYVQLRRTWWQHTDLMCTQYCNESFTLA